MEKKIFSSYAEIDRELEILKIEKEINYQKLVLSIQKTKDNLTPKNIIISYLGSFKNVFSGTYGSILNVVIPFAIKWIMNKKRGC
jgi:hypothetical protein